MGLFDFLTGNHPPRDGERLAAEALRQRLLETRDPGGKWRVRPAEDEGRADLVVEWGPIDQSFRALFGASGRHASKRMLLRLVAEEAMVRSVDQDGEFSWQADATGLRFEAAGFRGQSRQVGGSWSLGQTAAGGIGVVDADWWDSDAMKQPIRQVVSDAGWGWHGVAFTAL